MILVFGSINLDLIFDMEALPAPGETRLARAMRTEPGGKGANQAVAAAKDGAQVALYGAVGRDAFANPAQAGLESADVDVWGVEAVAGATGIASIVTDKAGRNAIAVAPGANLKARQDKVPDEFLDEKTLLLVQMECDPKETARLILRAHGAGARVILNLAPAAELPLEALKACWLIVVNEQEASFLAGQVGGSADAAGLAAKLGVGVLRTLGHAGSEASVDGVAHRVGAHVVKAIDTTAAGDCFVGVLAAALDRGLDLPAAMQRASVAAALACTKRGSQGSLPEAAEIDAAMRGA
ncbi:MAG: ribokinase [Rhodoblastus sp.]|nr:ribokinase [Rhodoblastus sp.]MCB9999256.1 ribokinase [Methylobacteriaceae bacterium]